MIRPGTVARNVVIVCLIGVVSTASAHIVPPEEYHPMAESYRRIAFMVNLNPVAWDLVEADAGRLADELSAVDAVAGKDYDETVTAVFEAIRAERSVSLETPTMRKRSAEAIFEASTIAVARGISAHLSVAQQSLGEHDTAKQHFEIARQIFKAVEHEVKYSDTVAFRKLGEAWLTASSSMGTPGVLGVGGVPADVEMFRSATNFVRDYVTTAFGEGYDANAESWMRSVPYRSASYDAGAEIPMKLAPGSNLNKQLPRPRQILNMAERGVSEMDTPLIALGDMAFDSPFIFGEPARSLGISCNTCHNKGTTNPLFFVAGLSRTSGGMDVSNSFFAPHANNGHEDVVDIPDLRGIRFTGPYGRNGRIASLRDFTRNVIVNEFNGGEPDPLILDSLVAYMVEFDFLPNEQIDAMGRLTDAAPEAAHRGEQIFVRPFEQLEGKSCATCHVPSNNFVDGLRHDIGSAGGSSRYSLDRALETPTLLSALYTPPYMHDGSIPTLRGVVEWFNAEHALDLKQNEVDDLVAYLEAVGSGEEAFEDTMFTLEAEMEEFSFFLSSYEYTKQQGKMDVAGAIFQTIAKEIEAHKWDVQDIAHLPKLEEMADVMRSAYAAVEQGDLVRTDELVEEYRELYAKYGDVLK